MNGTAPSDFWELGYIITGAGARELAKFFENRWLEAKPVKSLDLASIRTVLESGVFEGMSAP